MQQGYVFTKKEDSLVFEHLLWVCLARGEDGNGHNMHCIEVTEGSVRATDGHRLHAVELEPPVSPGLYLPKRIKNNSNKGALVLMPMPPGTNYPDTKIAIDPPRAKKDIAWHLVVLGEEWSYLYEIAKKSGWYWNPFYLIDALGMAMANEWEGRIIFPKDQPSNCCFVGKSEDAGQPVARVAVMPMRGYIR